MTKEEQLDPMESYAVLEALKQSLMATYEMEQVIEVDIPQEKN